MPFRTAVALSVLAFCLSGCRSPKAEGPGFLTGMFRRDKGAEKNVPPRKQELAELRSEIDRLKAQAEASEAGLPPGSSGSSTISLTDYSNQNDIPVELTGATVVAEVNSTPIFADDVLKASRFYGQLQAQKDQLTPEQINELRSQIIRNELQDHIQKAALSSALIQDLKDEQREQLDAQIDRLFDQHVQNELLPAYKVKTRLELERLLEEQDTSIDSLKASYAALEMAKFYISQQLDKTPQLSRAELQEWYNAHKEQYHNEEQVNWQQLRIRKGDDKAAAIEKLKAAVADLKAKKPFDEVAKQYSDGLKAEEGGNWGWTTKGSLADERIERAIFGLAEGKISAPIETDDAYYLVRVIEHKQEGYTPFDDVQEAINQKLFSEARMAAADKVINDVLASASVRTIFDGQK
jgi:parvulin-like peptidyl-prolyl isomerase